MWSQAQSGDLIKLMSGFVGEEQLKDTIGSNSSFWRKFQNDGHVVTPLGALNGFFKALLFVCSLSLFALLLLSTIDLVITVMPFIKELF